MPGRGTRTGRAQRTLFESENLLYYGDNLYVLREHVESATVDLIYLDPPFKSGQNYNLLFTERGGRELSLRRRRSPTPGIGTTRPSTPTTRPCGTPAR